MLATVDGLDVQYPLTPEDDWCGEWDEAPEELMAYSKRN